ESLVPSGENLASETKTESAKTEGPSPALLEETPLEPAVGPKAACPLDSESAEGVVPPASGGGRVQNSPPVGRKTLPLTTAPEAGEESPKLPQQSYNFDPDTCDESVDPFKTSSKTPSSPSKSPASFEIPASAMEANGVDGDGLNKPAKKKKTPLKTDTFRVKKSPKRSPLSDPPSQDPTPAATPETPPV
ncbi:transforming acidic coiled-coil containing protein 2, partial [Homo sapiens]